LMNAHRLQKLRIDAAGYVDLVVLTHHAQVKHSRNRRDTVIGESDHQAGN
jgi:hypothetical protein